MLWIRTIQEIRRVLFWFRVDKQTNQRVQLSCHFLLEQSTLCMETSYVPRHFTRLRCLDALVVCIFRGKIYPNYHDQSNITPCRENFFKLKLPITKPEIVITRAAPAFHKLFMVLGCVFDINTVHKTIIWKINVSSILWSSHACK